MQTSMDTGVVRLPWPPSAEQHPESRTDRSSSLCCWLPPGTSGPPGGWAPKANSWKTDLPEQGKRARCQSLLTYCGSINRHWAASGLCDRPASSISSHHRNLWLWAAGGRSCWEHEPKGEISKNDYRSKTWNIDMNVILMPCTLLSLFKTVSQTSILLRKGNTCQCKTPKLALHVRVWISHDIKGTHSWTFSLEAQIGLSRQKKRAAALEVPVSTVLSIITNWMELFPIIGGLPNRVIDVVPQAGLGIQVLELNAITAVLGAPKPAGHNLKLTSNKLQLLSHLFWPVGWYSCNGKTCSPML